MRNLNHLSAVESGRARVAVRHSAGHALGMSLHVLLVLAVVGQLVFLASHYRLRRDITGDQIYTLTDSTRRVLSGLDQQLLIEAYFSPDDTVPAAYRESRPNIRNFLDELVQVGNGKVLVQYLNPQEDKELGDRARRLGIRPFNLQDRDTTSVSLRELWQGLRLRYGEKQKVIPFLNPQPEFTGPAQLEMQITPAIKEVTLEQKANVGFMEWEVEAAGGFGNALEEQPQSWYQARMMPQIQGRYQFTNLRYTDVLVPDSIDTLILFRPKDLTDREKYIIDQFLMQGKTLVVFADSMEYEIGASRRFLARPFSYDAPDSDAVFLDQLAHYGIQVEEKLVADFHSRVQVPIYVPRVTNQIGIQRPYPLDLYPYFFRTVDIDWGSEQIVNQLTDNLELRQRYMELFQPGIVKSTPLTLNMARMPGQPTGGPGLFWACPVSLVEPLPQGVVGEELLFTSPLTLLENPPPANVRPMDFQAVPEEQERSYAEWRRRMGERVMAAPRSQVSLMATTRGTFSSYFAGKTIPTILGAAENPVRVVDPLALPIQDDPLAEPDPETEETGVEGAEQATGEDAEKEVTEKADAEKAGADTEQVEREGTVVPGAEVVDATSQDPPEGPPVPMVEPVGEDPDREPDPLLGAVAPARVVVIGDADFLRDDLVGGPKGFPYGQFGPVSPSGRAFFVGMLDWIYQDDDLVALHNRAISARVMSFAEQDTLGGERTEQFRERLTSKVSTLRWLNILVPPLLLLAFGAILALSRHAQKKTFLSAMES